MKEMLTAVAEDRVQWLDTAPEVTERALRYVEDRLASGLPTVTAGTRAELAHCRFHVGGKQLFGDDHRALVAAVDAGLVEYSEADGCTVLTSAGWARLEELMGS